ncbi:MAG TPA: FtsX-like permease family protein [Streptosporangiaceae bacterium]|nr:FtsX-like permease family protein [Streptosporangiaceae bacterium]
MSVLLSTLIASSLVAAFAAFEATALPQAVSDELAASGQQAITVSGAINSQQYRADRPVISSRISHAFAGVPITADDAVWSDPLGLPAPRGVRTVPLVQAAFMTKIESHVRLVAGAWPRPGAGRGALQAAVPANVAVLLRLKVGQVLVLHDRLTSARVSFRVTGTYRALDQAAPYWSIDPISVTGVSASPGFVTYGPFIVDDSAFSAHRLAIGGATWLYRLGITHLAADQLTPLASRLTKAMAFLSKSVDLGGLQTASGLPAVLRTVTIKLVVARSLLLVGELELLLLAGAALTLTARTLASQREDESATLRSRGAGRIQLLKLAAIEALVVTFVAAGAGALLGSRLSGLLARSGTQRPAGIQVTGVPADAWLTAGLVLLLCTAIMIWPGVRSVSPGALRIGRGRRPPALLLAAAGADVGLIALALVAGWQLRDFSVIGRTPAGLGIDPVLVLAPAIALAAGTVLPLRLLPLLARAGDKLAARTRRLGSALATWELSRRAIRQSAPMLLVVLAVGTSTLALAQHQSWRQSVLDQSAFTAGADVRAGTLFPATAGVAGTIAHAPGVIAAMAVSDQLEAPGNGETLAIDARHAPATVLLRGDEASPSIWRKIPPATTEPLITLPGHPTRLMITASMSPGQGPGRLGRVAVALSIMDGSGTVYSIPAGRMPADNRSHVLVARLTPTGKAIYPLRLVSITAGYTLPPLPGRHVAAARSRIAAFGVTGLAASAPGKAAVRLNAAALLRTWIPEVSAPAFALGGIGRPPERIVGGHHQSDPVFFAPGYGRITGFLTGGPTSPIEGQATLRARLPAGLVPAIATASYLRANRLKSGALVQILGGQATITARIVAVVSSFPTVTTSAGALIVDLSSVEEALAVDGQPPAAVTQWWLATKPGQVAHGFPPGTSFTDRARLATTLLSDPMSVIPQQAVQATALAAALLAILGFSVSVAGSVRERRTQSALLAALGIDGPAQARMLCVEALSLSVPAALTGLLLGTVLAHLLVPSVTLTSTAAAPVVPVLVKVPAGAALVIAFVVSAIPVLAAAASALFRPDPAAQLRAAEAA